MIPSKKLSTIRHRVDTLKPFKLSDKSEVHDLEEMLDEIQKKIDNAVTDAESLRKVTLQIRLSMMIRLPISSLSMILLIIVTCIPPKLLRIHLDT